MRKRFILPLTALVTVFLIASAAALGPVVSGVPDVYIGPGAAMGAPVEPGTNMFRYSSALELWDYVSPGVVSGDGSNSDTLYQAWAIKDATLSGGMGGYLALDSGAHYSILQENGVDALFVQPTVEVGGVGWAPELNDALKAQGAALSDYSLANAGALTFRNVRLSPVPDQPTYPDPTKSDAGLPDGVWDVQEATVYVSDTNTTPAADKVLLVTVDTGADFLAGGPGPWNPWTLVQDYRADTSDFVRFMFKGNENGTVFDFNPADLVIWSPVGTSSLHIETPVTNNPAGYWYYGQCAAIQGTVDPAYVYRMKAALTAPGGTLNPSILLAFNARGNAGYGFVQTNSGAAGGPTTTASTWSAFLAPLEPGTPEAQFIVFDSSSTAGGIVEASAIQIWRIALADLLASAEVIQATDTSFAVSATGAATATEWGYFDAPFSTTGGSPTLTRTPANGASGPIVMSAVTATANTGMASFQGPLASIPTTPGTMVIIRARLATTSSSTAKLPTVWLNTEGPTIQGGAFIQRDIAGTTGPSSTPRDYYLVFEAKDIVCAFNFRILADQASINGNVQLSELEVLEAYLPREP